MRLVNEFQRIKHAKIDSLKTVLETAEDTTKVTCLLQLYLAELQLNSQRAYEHLNHAGRISQQIGFKNGHALFLEYMGNYYMEVKNLPLAERYLQDAAAQYKRNNLTEEHYNALEDLGFVKYWQLKFNEAETIYNIVYNYRKGVTENPRIAYSYRHLGQVADARGNYEQAFDYYLKDMAISKEVSDSKGSRKSYGIFINFYLGNLYMQVGDKKNAVKYLRIAGEKALTNAMPDVYDRQLGQIHFILENYDSARYYFQLEQHCFSEWIKDSTIYDMAVGFSNISVAQTYVKQNMFDTAISLLQRSLKLYDKSIFATDIYAYLSKAYFGLNQFRQSLRFSRELMRISDESGARPLKKEAAEMHYKVFERLGKTDSAYKYLQMFLSISDSLNKEQQLRNIAVSEWQAADQQNKSAILVLNKEKIIRSKQNQVLLISLAALILAGLLLIRHFTLRQRHDKIKQAHLEMQALRAQMNPHFIFNSLNSINNFILRHDTAVASRYLTKFSRLIRMMLQHSQNPLIPLQDELDALKIYIELEQLRFDNRFEYRIQVHEDVDVNTFTVPPLIIQPFVENAIWHGLMQKKTRGRLEIRIYLQNNFVYCEVEDDGIGRKEAAKYKNDNSTTYGSAGVEITTKRISRLSKDSRLNLPVKIKDNVYPDGTAAGTTVIIKLPGSYD